MEINWTRSRCRIGKGGGASVGAKVELEACASPTRTRRAVFLLATMNVYLGRGRWYADAGVFTLTLSRARMYRAGVPQVERPDDTLASCFEVTFAAGTGGRVEVGEVGGERNPSPSVLGPFLAAHWRIYGPDTPNKASFTAGMGD